MNNDEIKNKVRGLEQGNKDPPDEIDELLDKVIEEGRAEGVTLLEKAFAGQPIAEWPIIKEKVVIPTLRAVRRGLEASYKKIKWYNDYGGDSGRLGFKYAMDEVRKIAIALEKVGEVGTQSKDVKPSERPSNSNLNVSSPASKTGTGKSVKAGSSPAAPSKECVKQ